MFADSDDEFTDADTAMFREPDGYFRERAPDYFVEHTRTQLAGDGDVDGDDDWQPRTLRMKVVGEQQSLWSNLLWPAAIVLADAVDARPSLVRGRRVAELGAGAALPSLVAALHGAARVVVTDYPADHDVLANIEHNVAALLAPHATRHRCRTSVCGYRWGDACDDLLALISDDNDNDNDNGNGSGGGGDGGARRRFDVLFLADLIFNHTQHAQLLRTCRALLDERHGEAWVTFTHHDPRKAHLDRAFFELAAQPPHSFAVRHHASVRKWAMFPNDVGNEEMRSTVHAYVLTPMSDEQAREHAAKLSTTMTTTTTTTTTSGGEHGGDVDNTTTT